MERLKLMLTGALFLLILYVAISLTILTMRQMRPVQADVPHQPAVAVADDPVEYLPLTDAQPRRDITQQRFAPLEEVQKW